MKSIISTQNDVVREVRAESAEEYAAAIIPIINKIPTYRAMIELQKKDKSWIGTDEDLGERFYEV